MLRHVSRTAPRLAARSRQASTAQTIMWTHTDEAPALASYALLPLVSRFAKSAGITVSIVSIVRIVMVHGGVGTVIVIVISRVVIALDIIVTSQQSDHSCYAPASPSTGITASNYAHTAMTP